MNIDVCILAGGKGTRLSGVWDKAKCLVPVLGLPVIAHLLEQVDELKPRRVCLALGHRADEVIHGIGPVLRKLRSPETFTFCVEREPLGTAGALRFAIYETNLKTPLLVLNGDTLPRYPLGGYVFFHDRVGNVDSTVAWHDGRHAGAAILNDSFLYRLARSSETDLSKLLDGASRYNCPGFLDVGTLDTFYLSQHLKEFP